MRINGKSLLIMTKYAPHLRNVSTHRNENRFDWFDFRNMKKKILARKIASIYYRTTLTTHRSLFVDDKISQSSSAK